MWRENNFMTKISDRKMGKVLRIENLSIFLIFNVVMILFIGIVFSPSRVITDILLYFCIISLVFLILFQIYILILKRLLIKKYSTTDVWLEVEPNGDSDLESNPQEIEHTLFPELDTDTRERINGFIDQMEKERTEEPPPKITFEINEFLSLRLLHNKTEIYIKNQPFKQCKFLLMNIDTSEIEKYDNIESIDDLERFSIDDLDLDRSLENGTYNYGITPEQEFVGHCSNLQAWYEHDYDTRILHSNISFPLLKKLTQVGDPKAQIRFKEEIVKRYLEGNDNVRHFLNIEGYLNYLTIDEVLFLVREVLEKEGKIKLKVDLRRGGLRHGKEDNFRLVSYIDEEDVSEFEEAFGENINSFIPENNGRLEIPRDDNNLDDFTLRDESETLTGRSEVEKEEEEEE